MPTREPAQPGSVPSPSDAATNAEHHGRADIWRCLRGVRCSGSRGTRMRSSSVDRASGQTHLLDAFSAAVLRLISSRSGHDGGSRRILCNGIRTRCERADPPGRCRLRALRPAGLAGGRRHEGRRSEPGGLCRPGSAGPGRRSAGRVRFPHRERPAQLAAPLHLLYADFPMDPPGGVCDFHVQTPSTPAAALPWSDGQIEVLVDRDRPSRRPPNGTPCRSWSGG